MNSYAAMSAADEATLAAQLTRPARGVIGIAYRCPAGHPGVVATAPRLPDGTPFPTTFYLTCPSLVVSCSRLESKGLMVELGRRLREDPPYAARYRDAHQAYLDARAELTAQAGLAEVAEIAGVSAGGMPDRVKCLHALVGHSLAVGPGINPVGDDALIMIGRDVLESGDRTACIGAPGHPTRPTEESDGARSARQAETSEEDR